MREPPLAREDDPSTTLRLARLAAIRTVYIVGRPSCSVPHSGAGARTRGCAPDADRTSAAWPVASHGGAWPSAPCRSALVDFVCHRTDRVHAPDIVRRECRDGAWRSSWRAWQRRAIHDARSQNGGIVSMNPRISRTAVEGGVDGAGGVPFVRHGGDRGMVAARGGIPRAIVPSWRCRLPDGEVPDTADETSDSGAGDAQCAHAS